MKKFVKGGVLALCLLYVSAVQCGEYDFDLSEIEKKPYSVGGSFELKSNVYDYDTSSPVFGLKYDNPDTADYLVDLRLNLSYEAGGLKYTVKSASKYFGKADESPYTDVSLMEHYVSYSSDVSFRVDAGKKTMKWGKGYAYNPAAFLDRPKNIDSPEDALEGYTLVSGEYTLSFLGALKTLSFNPAAYYVDDNWNRELGADDGVNFAGKLYALLYDTDIDLMFSGGESRGDRFGADFSRNISSNFEIHGEYAKYYDVQRLSVSGSDTVDSDNWIIGLRYLTENEITLIAEFFHKSSGYTVDEMKEFYAAADSDAAAFPGRLLSMPYSKNNPMRNYFYMRVSFKEPAGVLYFTPAVTLVANTDDGSFSLAPEAVYTGVTNYEFKLKAVLMNGGADSEYGEKTADGRIEASVTYYF